MVLQIFFLCIGLFIIFLRIQLVKNIFVRWFLLIIFIVFASYVITCGFDNPNRAFRMLSFKNSRGIR